MSSTLGPEMAVGDLPGYGLDGKDEIAVLRHHSLADQVSVLGTLGIYRLTSAGFISVDSVSYSGDLPGYPEIAGGHLFVRGSIPNYNRAGYGYFIEYYPGGSLSPNPVPIKTGAGELSGFAVGLGKQ